MSRIVVGAQVMFVVLILGWTAFAGEREEPPQEPSAPEKEPKGKAGTRGEPPPPNRFRAY